VRRAAIAGIALILGLSGCGDEDPPDVTAQARDFRFAPSTLRVPVGTTVTWRNTGRTLHNVKGPDFFSRAVLPGATWSHQFSKPGSYDYVCTLHPQAMRGRVVVGD
jgi:plastocyanin